MSKDRNEGKPPRNMYCVTRTKVFPIMIRFPPLLRRKYMIFTKYKDFRVKSPIC